MLLTKLCHPDGFSVVLYFNADKHPAGMDPKYLGKVWPPPLEVIHNGANYTTRRFIQSDSLGIRAEIMPNHNAARAQEWKRFVGVILHYLYRMSPIN